jgi:hypothetical protein
MQEESVAKAARELWKDKGRSTVKSAEWSESDGLLIYHGKIYVPKERELRHHIVKQHHNTHIAGHAGHFKTSSSYPAITGGHRCPATLVSMLSTVTCAIGLKCNVDDLSVSSTLQGHQRHHGT